MNNEEKILEMLTEMRTDIKQISGRLDKLEEDVSELKSDVKVLDERSLKSAVLLEADVTRDLQRLYEGHGAIMEKLDTLADREQVDGHESDISIMKDAIKRLRHRRYRNPDIGKSQSLGILNNKIPPPVLAIPEAAIEGSRLSHVLTALL